MDAYNVLKSMLLDESEEPRPLPLPLLESITNKFSEEMKIGSGGFADVYKGVLGSKMVAVKKLAAAMDMDEKQFIKEIECLMKVRHRNIVRFLGYCADTQGLLEDFEGKSVLADVRNRALCFEYVPKGSLDKHITDASCGLEWRVRYRMIKGICEGLHYLHKNNILHLDLKPANILVDDNMVPKIADFGLSRRLNQDQSTVIATQVVGSWGYFAPEYYDRKLSYKSDVYSLGVVVMEIMSGEKFVTAEEVLESWRNRLEKSQEDIPLEHVKACAEMGTMCIDPSAAKRPTTQHIIEVLKDLGGTDEFNEAGLSTSSSEAQMDAKASIAYDDLERMLLDESEEPKQLPLSLLEAITNNFCGELELSRAGFAVVYKGVLGIRTVSVKKVTDIDENRFNKEVQCLMKVRHKNIVRFLGYCADTKGGSEEFEGNSILADVRNGVLCFESVSNGSLDKYITDASSGLEWTVRREMIKGICEGLHHLHENSILHLDLKPSNILVNENMVPKLADFGLSRRLGQNKNYAMSASLIRKIEYWAPEFHTGESTFKSDIYSFGVIIMEILTGKKRFSTDEEVLKSWGTRLNISQEDEQEVRVCAQIGMKCMETNPKKRPTTQDIFKMFMGLQSEQVNALIACVGKNLGYYAGKPVAAFTIYKCLLHWKSLEADKTSIFDRLIQLIESAIQMNEENNNNLAYWLTNTSSLLFLLQKSINKAASVSRNKSPQPKSLFGRMGHGLAPAFFANLHDEATDDAIHQVEAKYPVLLFKQQLTAYVEKIYVMVRDNMKRELSPLIALCIQAPRTMKQRVSVRLLPDESQNKHWVNIVERLDDLLMIVQDNHVPDILAQKIFMQIFMYINEQLFNSLLVRRECCSFSNGEYVKAGLDELESWCAKAKTKYAASSWDELKHIIQTIGFLVIFQKFRISYDEIVNDLCPILSVEQLYRICTQYWDDKYNTQSVSSDVLSNLRVVMSEYSYNAENNSFLLDGNSSIPFTVDDITNSIQDFSDIKAAEELLKNPAFQFLQDH